MQLEALESRTFLSAEPHAVTVPHHASAEGNLQQNVVVGHATRLGRFTGAFVAPDLVVFTAANGDELWVSPVLTPVSDTVFHVEGNYVGGTGRFAGASGSFEFDLTFVNQQGDFVYQHGGDITLQRPWNEPA